MPNYFRTASFNVENLFGRVKVFNFQDHTVGDQILMTIDEFRSLLKKDIYTPEDKTQIVELYNELLKPYIEVNEDRGKLFKKRGWTVTGVQANGVNDWDGAIEFKRAKFSETARENTARVIKEVRADIACIVEAESRPALRAFDSDLLGSRYAFDMLIDGNDPRGIDVGLYSKYPLGAIWTHLFDRENGRIIFSRDCLEVEIFLPGNQPLYMLCNHFKSRGYDLEGNADEKRQRQANHVAQILGKYDLANQWVIVAGDFNDNPTSPTLQPLLSLPHLYDVLELQFGNNTMERWTYHYEVFEQIDFILVSNPLKERFRKAGVLRRGINKLNSITSESDGLVKIEQEYETVTHWTNAASDHGAVWAEFDL